MAPVNPPPTLTAAYSANSRWLMDHMSDLQREYPNQWVAIHGNRVIAAGAELGIVTAQAGRLAAPVDTVVCFIDDGSLIFSAGR